jgi:hypothetical protein
MDAAQHIQSIVSQQDMSYANNGAYLTSLSMDSSTELQSGETINWRGYQWTYRRRLKTYCVVARPLNPDVNKIEFELTSNGGKRFREVGDQRKVFCNESD